MAGVLQYTIASRKKGKTTRLHEFIHGHVTATATSIIVIAHTPAQVGRTVDHVRGCPGTKFLWSGIRFTEDDVKLHMLPDPAIPLHVYADEYEFLDDASWNNLQQLLQQGRVHTMYAVSTVGPRHAQRVWPSNVQRIFIAPENEDFRQLFG